MHSCQSSSINVFIEVVLANILNTQDISMYQLTFNEAPFMICMGSTTFPRLFDIFLPCASHIMPWSITSYESQMKRSSHNISFMQKAWCKMVTWSFESFFFKRTISSKTPIPRKIMLSPYAKKCFVFNHIFRTECWYWVNTSTSSFYFSYLCDFTIFYSFCPFWHS